MKKLVVVMTAFNRKTQTVRTLKSINESKHENFEVILVDDGSTEDIEIPEINYTLHVIRLPQKTQWRDSSVAYNTGFAKAIDLGADIVMIQNAECAHMGDVISNAVKNVDGSNYITYACLSLNESDTDNELIWYKIAGETEFGATTNGETAWYNHSAIRPMGYHFCSAISVENLKKINGFDERFSDGIAFDDDYLKHRILTLGLDIYICDAPFVVHQYHETMHRMIDNNQELYERNRQLYFELIELNEYAAKHIYTPDL